MSGGDGDHETSDSQYALVALAAIFAVTVGWWALALWPVPGNPAWLDRARIVPESGARDEVVDTVEKGGIEGHSDLGLGMTV